MNSKDYILGIDAGTSLIKVLISDRESRAVVSNAAAVPVISPAQGRAEQDPKVIWNTTLDLILKSLSQSRISLNQIAAIGLANQRETTVFWNRKTGKPYGNAVVWMDKRAEGLSREMSELLGAETVDRVGMYVIPNTAGMIIKWLLDNDSAIGDAVEKGDACFGTLNSWLLWQLTGGEVHCSDLANMSITLLQNARELKYDEAVLTSLHIPQDILPDLRGTGAFFGETREDLFGGAGRIPVTGMLGDQMASALGQGCISEGMVKNTYGTGSFLVMNVGNKYVPPARDLFSSFLWGDNQNPAYALEGFSETCGSAVDWLKNSLKLIHDPSETEEMAKSADDGERLYFVPASIGSGGPGIDGAIRSAFPGIKQDATAAHMVKAVLDGIVYQTADKIKTLQRVTGKQVESLRVDGGVAKNNYICQFQADILGVPVERSKTTESTVWGAIYQAGLSIGFWNSLEETASMWEIDKRFEPSCLANERDALYSGWREALEKANGCIRST